MSVQPIKRKRRQPQPAGIPGIPVYLPPIPSIEGPSVPIPEFPTHQGPWYKRPELPGMLMSIGAALAAPPTLGMTGWGQIAQAMGAGYNYLQNYAAARQQAMQDAWERQMAIEQLKAQQRKQIKEEEYEGRRVAATERTAATQERRADIEERQVEAQIGQGQQRIDLDKEELSTRKAQFEWQKGKFEKEHALALKQLELEQAKLAEMRRSHMAQEAIAAQEARVKQMTAEAHMLRAQASAAAAAEKIDNPDDMVKNPRIFAQLLSNSVKAIQDASLMSGGKPVSEEEATSRAVAMIFQAREDVKKRLGMEAKGQKAAEQQEPSQQTQASEPQPQEQQPKATVTIGTQGFNLPPGVNVGDVVVLKTGPELKGTEYEKNLNGRRARVVMGKDGKPKIEPIK